MNKKYCLVVTDDYSRFTWVFFLASKDESSSILKSFITEIENLVDKKVKIIRCNNGTEFKNRVISEFCEKKGIKREFSVARTPQQNGVAERRNRTLIEAARTMLADFKLPATFWADAVNTACYVQNRVLVVKPHNKTPYELFRGRTPALSFMRPFGCHVTILNTLDHLGKFDGNQDAFDVHCGKMVIFDSSSKNASNDEPQPSSDVENKDDEGVRKESGIDNQERLENSSQDVTTVGPSINTASTNINTGSLNINTVSPPVTTALLEVTHANFFGDETELYMSNITITYPVPSTPNTRIHKDHSLDHVIGDVQSGVQTRRMTRTTNEPGFISAVYEEKTHEDIQNWLFACFLSQVEPKKVIQALTYSSWIEAMWDELLQFKLQKVWTLVDLPYGKRAIGTKWVYRNKKDERVARIEAIRLFLAYASFKDFVVYQMNVKSAFLYGKIEEEVYVCQPPGFEDLEFPDRVYKVEKALYGLHQAPRDWYETLSTYLLENGFQRGRIDKTLFIKRIKGDILLVQVYVDDIIFGSTKKELCAEFEKLMHKKFQMSSMGELTFFLGLQMTQKDDVIFISQDKYVDEILKKFGFSTVKTGSTPMETSKPFFKDAEAEDVDVHLYRSMIGSLMYLTASRPDIMFDVCACARFQVTPKFSHLHAVKRIFRYLKGQPIRPLETIVVNSITEAEYVAASSCYGQVCSTWNNPTYLCFTPPTVWELLLQEHLKWRCRTKHLQWMREVRLLLEALLGRHLKLEDSDGITSLPTTKIFELSLMGDLVVQGEGSTVHLYKKVKRLEKKDKLSKSRRKARIIVSDDEEDLEDPSKQGKKIDEIDQDPNISLVQHDTSVIFDFNAAKEVSTAEENVSTAEPVSTAGAAVTTTSVAISTATPTRVSTIDDIASESLVYIRRSAAKTKDKGKSIMEESESTMTRTKGNKNKKRLGLESAGATRGIWMKIRGKVAHESEDDRAIPKLAAESSKRPAEEELDQPSSKKQKTGESSEPRDKEFDELSQEELHQMMIITLGSTGRSSVGNHTEVYQFFNDMLKAFDIDDLVMLWSLVKEKFNSTEPTDDKEREIIVHHVSTKDGLDIYMLVEREYPLSKGVLTHMLISKLLVEQDNEMSRELLRKIFMQAERPRR
ncbi:putative ribonuclease H-like domain-containing protein [Tanacetum coccineum]